MSEYQSTTYSEEVKTEGNLSRRFPRSLPMVIVDYLEKLYLAGFCALHLFVTVFPLIAAVPSTQQESSSASNATVACTPREGFICPEAEPLLSSTSSSGGALEFLPLMVTSVYCAIGLTWAFLRLSLIYLKSSSKS